MALLSRPSSFKNAASLSRTSSLERCLKGMHFDAPSLAQTRPPSRFADAIRTVTLLNASQGAVFEHLDSHRSKELHGTVSSRALAPGAAVRMETDPSDALFLILNGTVELFANKLRGEPTTLRAPAIVGDLRVEELLPGMAAEATRGADAVFAGAGGATVRVLPREGYLRVATSAPEVQDALQHSAIKAAASANAPRVKFGQLEDFALPASLYAQLFHESVSDDELNAGRADGSAAGRPRTAAWRTKARALTRLTHAKDQGGDEAWADAEDSFGGSDDGDEADILTLERSAMSAPELLRPKTAAWRTKMRAATRMTRPLELH